MRQGNQCITLTRCGASCLLRVYLGSWSLCVTQGCLRNLTRRQPLVGVHVQHLGHQILRGQRSEVTERLQWSEKKRGHKNITAKTTGNFITCVHTLASEDTDVQYPPLSENFPLPIRARISSGVSSGPLANGVKLETDAGQFTLVWFSCL